jgi:hypothetical protein
MGADRGASQPASPGRPFGALVDVVARTSGASALRRALPTYLGLFVIAVILFAGYGVRSSDVVALALGSPHTRVALLAAWLLLALPAARALIAAPSAFLIRTWPIPRARLLGVTTAMLVLVESPWLLLWFKGGGVVAGLAATAIALGGHGLLLARPRGAAEIAAALLWLVAIATLSRLATALLAAAPAVVLAVRRAFIAAPEQIGVRRARRWVRAGRSAVIALAQMHLATIVRAQRPALLRALWFAAGGALFAGLAAANNGIGDLGRVRAIWRTMAVLAIGWGAAGLVGGVQEVERRAAWLLEVHGVTSITTRLGAALALAGLGASLGAIAGAALGHFSPARAAVALALDGALAGLAGATTAALAGRWASRGSGRDSARLLAAMLIGGAILAACAWFLPGAALLAATVSTLAIPEPHAPRGSRAAGPAALGAGRA